MRIKILDRYIFLSVSGLALGAVSLLTFILLAGSLLRDLIKLAAAGQLPGVALFKLLVLLLPYIVSFALPMGILCGTLIAIGRLSSGNEITAMKSSGISIWRISAPVLAVALLGAIVAGISNSHLAPMARSQYRSTLASMLKADPVAFIEEQTFIEQFPGYVLFVGRKEGAHLEDFWIWELDKQRRVTRLLRAREGDFRYLEDECALVLDLKRGFTEIRNEKTPNDLTQIRPVLEFNSVSLKLPLDKLLGSGSQKTQKRSSMTVPELRAAQAEAEARLAKDGPGMKPEERARLEVQAMQFAMAAQRAAAMGVSVLTLAFVGIPLSLQVGRKETYANIAFALALGILYYFLMIVVEWLEGVPALRPDLLMWAPNVVFLVAGVVLMRRAARH